MQSGEASRTAVAAAHGRAFDAEQVDPVLNDCISIALLTESERSGIRERAPAALPLFDPSAPQGLSPEEAYQRLMHIHTGLPVTRQRVVDDAINNAVRNSRVTHIINLGAGLDSTGIRLADIIGSIPYTEIDHPLTQKVKRERLHSAGIATPGNVHFQPIDFATQRLTDVMPAPSNGANIVSLTGVTYYLQMSAIMDTLASVAEGSSRGSQLIFDYLEPDGLTANAPPSVQMTRVVAERYGEPMMTAFDPKTIGQKLANAGWQIEEDLSPQDLGERYLERHPEYIPLPHFRVARAVRV